MPVNKNRLLRLVRLVAELKENRYPNCESFASKLCELDISDGKPLSCTAKTVQRDIKTLKNDFNAPIAYDQERKGFYLKHHGWEFRCPIFQESELLASIIGARLAENMLPEPVKGDVRRAIDGLLTENNPDFLDNARLDTLIMLHGLKATVRTEVFKVLFDAWQRHRVIEIVYVDSTGKRSSRIVEPHVLAYDSSAWFIRAYCHLRNGVRTFSVHRIFSAKETGKTFEPDAKIIAQVKGGHLFDYIRYSDIEIECSLSLRQYVDGYPLHGQQRIEEREDGSFLLKIPSAAERELLSWILVQRGDARLIKPTSAKRKLAAAAQRILSIHEA